MSDHVYSGQQMRLDILNCLLWVIMHIFIQIFWSSQWCTGQATPNYRCVYSSLLMHRFV